MHRCYFVQNPRGTDKLWQWFSHWDGWKHKIEIHLLGCFFFHSGSKIILTQVLESGGVPGRRGWKKNINKRKEDVCRHTLSFDFWLTLPSQVNNAMAHLVSLSIIGAHFSEDPLPLATLPSSNKGTIKSECLHNQKICLRLCTCCGSSTSFIFGEARTH